MAILDVSYASDAEKGSPAMNDGQVTSGGLDPVLAPRPITSTLDTWDELTKLDYPSNPSSPGRRPLWNVPNIAITGESVNTIRSSVANRAANPSIAKLAATTVSPTYAPGVSTANPFPFRPVASMSAAIKPTASVQISWSTQISSAIATSPMFAIYRDGRLISQQYQQLTAGGNVRSNFAATYIDNTASPLKHHTYTLYCRPTNTPITFFQLGRVFQVSDLRAS